MPRRRVVVNPLTELSLDELNRLVVEINKAYELAFEDIATVERATAPSTDQVRARASIPDRSQFIIEERLRALEQEVYVGTLKLRSANYVQGAVGGGEPPPPPPDDDDPPPTGPPLPPANVHAVGGDGQVTVTWSGSSGATIYRVRRGEVSGGPYGNVSGDLGASARSFTDTSVVNGTPYFYVVVARNQFGGSGISNESSATPQAGVPGSGFSLVHAIPDGACSNPCDMWAGRNGSGFDGALFMTMGGRKTGDRRGGAIVRHLDSGGVGDWQFEFQTDGASSLETINKIRSNDALNLYAWSEGPRGAGQTTLMRRSAGSALWTFEAVPKNGNTVGGRGLALQGPNVFVGQSENWTDGDARVYFGTAGGAYALLRAFSNTLTWELEFDTLGRLWEFYVQWDGVGGNKTILNGAEVPSPSNGIRAVDWFPNDGHMYATIGLQSRTGRIARTTGAGWGTVLDVGGEADHVRYVPRGGGELWATYYNPFSIYRSFDGINWVLMHQESFDTDSDTNQLTAIAYYNGKMWAAVRNADAGATYIYKEN